VWTATSPSGLYDDQDDCYDFTNAYSGFYATKGSTGRSDGGWTSAQRPKCNTQGHVYCFQDLCPGVSDNGQLLWDEQNCGSCGFVCPGVTECVDGMCGRADLRLVFVTEGTFDGSLGSISAADDLCRTEAEAANVSGEWMALLGDGTVSVDDRMSGRPLYRLDGVLVAASEADLFDGTLAAPIDMTESGETLPADEWAWTGSLADGGLGPASCEDWTWASGSPSATGTVGTVGATADGLWLSAGVETCDQALHVYCYEYACPGLPIVDFANDELNCGGCGTVCPARQVCTEGECVWDEPCGPDEIPCRGDLHCVGGKCVLSDGRKVMFTTSTTHNGDFGGLAGADAFCQARADAANLGGTFIAFLGRGGESSAYEFWPYERLPAESAYYRLDGLRFVARAGNIGTCFLDPCVDRAPDRNEFVEQIPAGSTVWTGGAEWTGSYWDWYMCEDWAPSPGPEWASGQIGRVDSTNMVWLDYTKSTCSNSHRLYCFQL